MNAFKTLQLASRGIVRPRTFATASPPVFASIIDDLRVRVKAYGPERFRLASVATITESPAGGFEVRPFDDTISKDLQKALLADAKGHRLKVHLDKGGLRLVPFAATGTGTGTHTTWKAQRRSLAIEPRDDGLMMDDGSAWQSVHDLDDAHASSAFDLAPASSKLSMRLNKAWAPVDLKKATAKRDARKALMHKKREATAMAAVEAIDREGDLSNEMAGRFQRLAARNGKAMRRLLKTAAAKAGLDDYFPAPAPTA
jgi:hypothetical protein